MKICKIMETNPTLIENIRSVGFKLLGTPEDRTPINISYLAIYLINIIIIYEPKLYKAYNQIGKENILIALYSTEILLKDIETNFLRSKYTQVAQDLASFLINLSASAYNRTRSLC